MFSSNQALTKIFLLMGVIFGSGCIQNVADFEADIEGHLEADDQCLAAPTCHASETASNALCMAHEVSCRREEACDEIIFCRETQESQCHRPLCRPGYDESETPCADDDLNCYAFSACGETLYCRLPEYCGGFPSCEPGYEGSNDSCRVDETDCVPESQCGQTTYCRPIQCPPVILNCPDGYEACDPSDPVEGCDQMTIGTGPCAQERFCMETFQCDAVPTCPEGQRQSQDPCLRGEPECESVTVCDSTSFCRWSLQCEVEDPWEVASCHENEYGTPYACEPGEEETCRNVSECGVLRFCRIGQNCRGIAQCLEGEVESDTPCRADERDCITRSMCMSSVICRPER